MSNSKRILSFVMAFAMVMTVFSGMGAIFAPKAAAEALPAPTTGYSGAESVIKTMDEIKANGYADGSNNWFIYFGIDFYEQNAAGDYELTDHYVNPGQNLRGYVYYKSNLWIGAGTVYFVFDRNFFDVTNGATNLTYLDSYDPNHEQYPTENYPANIKGSPNTAHAGVAANGNYYNYTTKWARNVPGFKEAANLNFHDVPLAESDTWDFWYFLYGRDATSTSAYRFDVDDHFFTFDIKVREFMPDGVTKLADGTTGFVKLDKRCFSIWDNQDGAGDKQSKRQANINVRVDEGAFAQAKRMNVQNFYDVNDFMTDDCAHTFTIGQNPDNMPSYGETQIKTMDEIKANGYADGSNNWFIYFGIDFYEQDSSTGEWNFTDHYVNPGDTLRGYVYYKSNLWIGAGTVYFVFDRNFFDVTNGATGLTYLASYDPNHEHYPTENYPANIKGSPNTAHAGVAANGNYYNYTTKWARNVPGFKEAANLNFHDVPLAESDTWDFWYFLYGRDATSTSAYRFDVDDHFFTFDIKVREFMPDGVTKLADGTTGFVKLDKRCFSIWDNQDGAGDKQSKRQANINVRVDEGAFAQAKRMNVQNFYDINDFMTDDCAHTFTIGKPAAGGKEYTATFTVDGEAYGDPVTAKKGDSIAAPETAPVKAGYTFAGWALEGSTDVLEFPQTMGEADVTYVAIFTALPKYTATFYADGVQVGEVNEYYEGDTIVAPQAPTKVGYTFVEWAPEVGVMPAENVVFNAVYEAKTYTATWVVDGATYDTTTATYDADYVLPTPPTKEGNTFAGWYADASFSTAIAEKHTVDGNVTFYAKFTTDSFTITFDTDGGSAIDPATYAFGATVVEPAAPTKTGYTFAGWSPALPTTMPAENITVVAQWTAVASGVTFMDGDTVVLNIPGVYGDVITTAMVPAMSKDGFNFTGWKDAEGNTVTFPQTLGTEALVVYAQWTAKSYYIEFYNGDEWLAGNNQLCGAAIVTPEEPTKTGYEFAGWVDGDGNPMPETVPAKDNQVYFATFRPITYDAVFMNGSEVYETVQGGYQSSIAAPEDPTMEGYTFQYWAKEGTTAKVTFPAKMPLNGIKYVAIYKVNTYTITYYVDGVEVFSEDYDFGATVTPYDYKPAEGVTFGGWGDQVPATMPANNVDVYGSTGVANYTVTFTVNGEVYKEVEFAYGAAVTAPAYDIPEGYSFTGWDVPATMPAQNITLDASLTINSYWARWYLDADKTILYHEELVEFGKEIPFPEDPTEADIPGQLFDIWDDDTVTTMVVGGVDYVAMTTPIEYLVQFNNEDGTAIDGADWIAYYGDVITEDDAPVVTKEGFEFKGWLVNGEKVTLPYTVTGDVTFTASFGIVSYDVMWVVDGKILYTDSYDFGDAIVMRADEVKEGYTFSGWDKDLTGMTMPAEDITVTGNFTVNVYNALFYADGELIETVPTNFGEVPVAPQAPDKTGYAFIGWAPALAPMVVAPEGVRYDAVYSAGAVAYKVEIYTMDTEGAYGAPEVLNLSADADAAISYAPAAKTGFTVDADASVLEGTAAADGSAVLKVYYIRDQYDLTLTVDGESTTVTYYYDEAVEEVADPVKEGYKFIGWDGTVPTTMPARDVALTARFQILQFTVTYNTNGGTLIPSFTADYGTAVVAPADPTKTGYTFAGWDGEVPATIPANNVVLNAQWTINQYTITFVDTGDVAYDEIKQDYASDIADIADPVKTGYTFTGWDVEIPDTMPAKDMTITATWKVNQYPATFVIDGVSKDVATDFGAMPVAPEASKLGYTFGGWQAADGTVYAADALPVMGVDGATYTAVFTANKYDAIFNADGGVWTNGESTWTVEDVTFGEAITAPAEEPTKQGYIFKGWNPAVGNMTAEGMTFTAIWEQNLDFCRVQSVERLTADVYGPQLAQYAIKVMGSPVKVQIAYADATNVTWTFDRNDTKVAADNSIAGLVSVTGYTAADEVAGEGDEVAYEIWVICTVLTEDNYKVRAKVDYSSASWESLAFAYDYSMAYDKAPVAETMVYSADSSVATIKRGKTGVITIVTDASVTRVQLKMVKADGSTTTVSYAPTSSAVKYDDSTLAAENKASWAITITFTYAGTAAYQDQHWVVWYRTSLTTWTETDKSVDVKVTRTETASSAPAGTEFSVISVAGPATAVVGAESTITVVTTNDVSRVRLNNEGKTVTYLKTSNNVEVAEDTTAGTYTWTITYRFGTVSDDQVWYAQCRGSSWSALEKSFTVDVTE